MNCILNKKRKIDRKTTVMSSNNGLHQLYAGLTLRDNGETNMDVSSIIYNAKRKFINDELINKSKRQRNKSNDEMINEILKSKTLQELNNSILESEKNSFNKQEVLNILSILKINKNNFCSYIN